MLLKPKPDLNNHDIDLLLPLLLTTESKYKRWKKSLEKISCVKWYFILYLAFFSQRMCFFLSLVKLSNGYVLSRTSHKIFLAIPSMNQKHSNKHFLILLITQWLQTKFKFYAYSPTILMLLSYFHVPSTNNLLFKALSDDYSWLSRGLGIFIISLFHTHINLLGAVFLSISDLKK